MRVLTLTGRVGADAQVKVTTKGKPYLEFRIANNEYGDPEGSTFWTRVVAYNTALINMAQYYTKGKSLIVTGAYKNNTYPDKSKNIVVGNEIVASAIYFNSVDGGEHKNGSGNGQQAPEQHKPEPAPQPAPAASPTVDANADGDDLPF